MADRSPVDTAELRRLLTLSGEGLALAGAHRLLDEIDALRSTKVPTWAGARDALDTLNPLDTGSGPNTLDALAKKAMAEIDALRLHHAEHHHDEDNMRGGYEDLETERDALRAKLAESEAACAVLFDKAVFSPDVSEADYLASVLAHMEEDAALREVAKAASDLWRDLNLGKDLEAWQRARQSMTAALAHLDAVRAKGGG